MSDQRPQPAIPLQDSGLSEEESDSNAAPSRFDSKLSSSAQANSSCPDEESLVALLRGELAVELSESIAEHLAACQVCREQLDRVSLGPEQTPFHLRFDNDSSYNAPSQHVSGRMGRADKIKSSEGDTQNQELDSLTQRFGIHVENDERRNSSVVCEIPKFALPGYETLEIAGRGGMGVVFKARDVALDRLVAIKVVHGGLMAGPLRINRFLNEAKVIARLNHPNIVRVLAAGQQGGQPYYVMEWCDGQPLSSILDGTPWAVADALDLLIPIAYAVHASHQQHVIHRDLKPANILVRGEDERKVPMLVDFGLAKDFSGDDLTRTGEVMGTPCYIAPEQAAAQHDLIGPQTDVYSLGCILYELLTGRAPFKASSVADTLQQILHGEPVQLSLLNPRVPRDLETVCLYALRRDPTRRYASAEQMAEDLQAVSAGDPIVARRPSIPERINRWVRKHPVATTTLGASTIAGLTLLAVWASFTHRLSEQTTRAEVSAETSQRVLGYFVDDLLLAAMPERLGRELKVIDVLQVSDADLFQRFGDRPHIEATIRQTLARLLNSLGESQRALQHADRAVSIWEQTDPAQQDHQLWRARLVRLDVLLALQLGEEAEQAAMQLRNSPLPDDSADRIRLKLALAQLGEQSGRWHEAEQTIRKTIDEAQRTLSASHELTIQSWGQLANILLIHGRIEEMAESIEKYVDGMEQLHEPDHPAVISAQLMLAVYLQRTDRFDDAEAVYKRLLPLAQRVFGPKHLKTIELMQNYAMCLSRQGQRDEAEPIYLQCIPICLESLGQTHLLTVNILRNLAVDYQRSKRIDDALQLLQSSIDAQTLVEMAHNDAGLLLLNWAWLAMQDADFDTADSLLQDLQKVVSTATDVDPELERQLTITRSQLAGMRVKNP